MASKRTFSKMQDESSVPRQSDSKDLIDLNIADSTEEDFELRKTVLDLWDFYDDLYPNDDPTTKPLYTYTEMILMTVLHSPNYCLPIGEIYRYIQNRFSYFREGTSKYWRNAVRHSLSKTKCFGKIGVSRMPTNSEVFKRSTFLWSIVPVGLTAFARGDYRPSEKHVGVNKIRILFTKAGVSSLWSRCQQTIAIRLDIMNTLLNTVPKPGRIFEKQTITEQLYSDTKDCHVIPSNTSSPEIVQPVAKRQCIGVYTKQEPTSPHHSSSCAVSPSTSFAPDQNDSGYFTPPPIHVPVNNLDVPKMSSWDYTFYTDGNTYLPELSPFTVSYLPTIPDIPPLCLTYDDAAPARQFATSYLPYYNGYPFVYNGDCRYLASTV